MNILLDTHIALWYLNGDAKLSGVARSYIDDRGNDIYFSIASMWEIEIKHILHPDRMVSSGDDVLLRCEKAGFTLLPVHPEHVRRLHTLCRAWCQCSGGLADGVAAEAAEAFFFEAEGEV